MKKTFNSPKKISNPQNFDGEYYKEQLFEKTDFKNQVISEIEFYKCEFVSCIFVKSVFDKCVFEKCEFRNCDLSVVDFAESALIDAEFTDSKLIGIDWTKARKPIYIDFLKCVLNDSSFYKLDLRSRKIESCTAHNVDFEEINLSKAICSRTDFLGSKFNGADLSEADFTEAVNYSIDPNNTKIKKAKFSHPEVLNLLDAWDIIIE